MISALLAFIRSAVLVGLIFATSNSLRAQIGPGPAMVPILLAANPNLGPVVFDADGTGGTGNGYAASATSVSLSSTTSATITVGSGTHRALVVALSFLATSTAPTGVTCTWDVGGTNQAMTQIGLTSNALRSAALFGLVAPTSGNKTLTCSWTNTQTDAFIGAISFTGVDQTGGATSFYNYTTATGTGTNPSVTVTSATTDAAVETTQINSAATVNQTQLYKDATHGSIINSGAAYNVGSASVTFTWNNVSTSWVNVACAIKGG